MRTYHEEGTQPLPDQVFVFGSNTQGCHLGGAANAAYKQYGAAWGISEGPTGQSYAIPTIDGHTMQPVRLKTIRNAVTRFVDYSKQFPELTFFVTRIGCGIAGYMDADVAPMFVDAPPNCSMPEPWRDFLDRDKTILLPQTIRSSRELLKEAVTQIAQDACRHDWRTQSHIEAYSCQPIIITRRTCNVCGVSE